MRRLLHDAGQTERLLDRVLSEAQPAEPEEGDHAPDEDEAALMVLRDLLGTAPSHPQGVAGIFARHAVER
jgi:hypothetical protein